MFTTIFLEKIKFYLLIRTNELIYYKIYNYCFGKKELY